MSSNTLSLADLYRDQAERWAAQERKDAGIMLAIEGLSAAIESMKSLAEALTSDREANAAKLEEFRFSLTRAIQLSGQHHQESIEMGQRTLDQMIALNGVFQARGAEHERRLGDLDRRSSVPAKVLLAFSGIVLALMISLGTLALHLISAPADRAVHAAAAAARLKLQEVVP